MTLRVKSDKEYAALLLSMTQQMEKQETADYVSTVSKVSGSAVGSVGGAEHVNQSKSVCVCVCVPVVVAGDSSDRGVGSDNEKSRRRSELGAAAPSRHADPGQTAGEEELPKSSSAAGEPHPQGVQGGASD